MFFKVLAFFSFVFFICASSLEEMRMVRFQKVALETEIDAFTSVNNVDNLLQCAVICVRSKTPCAGFQFLSKTCYLYCDLYSKMWHIPQWFPPNLLAYEMLNPKAVECSRERGFARIVNNENGLAYCYATTGRPASYKTAKDMCEKRCTSLAFANFQSEIESIVKFASIYMSSVPSEIWSGAEYNNLSQNWFGKHPGELIGMTDSIWTEGTELLDPDRGYECVTIQLSGSLGCSRAPCTSGDRHFLCEIQL